jgi:phosphate transport system substrate-binding protein
MQSVLGMALAVALALVTAAAQAAETVRVGGTGVGLAWAGKAARMLEAQNREVHIEVLPSLGTPGGLRALLAGAIEVGLAARSLKEDETAKGLREAACLRSAFAFATSRPAAPGIQLSDLSRIYGDPNPLWPDGQPIKVILRSPAGSENSYLASLHPGVGDALAAAAKRLGIPVGNTDQENVELLARTEGSFGMTTTLQAKAENLALTLLSVDGVEATPKTLADGSYPMPMNLCFVLPPKPSAGAETFIAFLRSDAGRWLARTYGAEPLD